MNSTVESFSENAWDNYQAAPYSCISSDPGVEKLDPGHLQADWEHNLEFEDDFGQRPEAFTDDDVELKEHLYKALRHILTEDLEQGGAEKNP